ncbi:titin [Notolabrus celidotus]|uniref:titin n=1 Tax=Notolabrus celidotus TaxID=1203425 RepID=UPI00149024B6|nr:titin [Notolabrus celidotus]
MTHPRDTASTCAAQWKMRLIGILCVIYLTAVCAAQGPPDAARQPGDTPPPTTLPAAITKAVPHVRMQLQSPWPEVFPSEKVEFRCDVTGSSDWTFIWQRNKKQIRESDPNVSINADRSVLTITAADQTYMGFYSCTAQHKTEGITTAESNSVGLIVHDNKPKPIVSRKPNFAKFYPGESATFNCTVQVSSGWEYLWFHNGKQIQTSNSFTINPISHNNNGRYHCQAKRGKSSFYTEQSLPITLQVSDPPTPSLKLLTQWPDVFEEEILAFSCEVGNSDWTFTWYKNNRKLQDDYPLTLDDEGTLLNITSVAKLHEGEYACKAELESRAVSSGFSNTVAVTVYDNVPKAKLHKAPGFKHMYVGETVTFTCNVDVSTGWEYELYKGEDDLPITNSFPVDLSKQGKYSCKATRGQITSTENSEEMQLDVREIPVPSLKNISSWLDVFPDESMQLRCGMGIGSSWTYTWSRDGQKVQVDSVVTFDQNGATLSIKSAKPAHAGQYKCKGHLEERSVNSISSSGLTLTVHNKKPSVTLTQEPDYKVMFSGESVSFNCHINVSSGWEYLWYKDAKQLPVFDKKYSVTSVSKTDTGSYRCEAKRGTAQLSFINPSQAVQLQVQENKPKPLMTPEPNVTKLYVGELVSFKCKVEVSTGWRYLWYTNGTQLHIDTDRLTFNATLSNSGIYNCCAVRDKTMYSTEHSEGWTVDIAEIPLPSTKAKTTWLDVFPSERVNMSCGMNDSKEVTSDWMYTWYKDNQKVQADDTTSLEPDGTLSIKSASASQQGRYSCSAKLKSRSVYSSNSSGQTLVVYDTKPQVMLTQTPVYNGMHTGDSVSFSCHINISSGWEYLWFKDNRTLVKPGNSFTIMSAVKSDSGSYKCQVRRGKDSVLQSDQSEVPRLSIQERPQASIILLTGWAEVFSAVTLELKCGVQKSQDTWNYTWFREDKPIQKMSEKYVVTPQNDPEQSQYTCMGIRNGRPSYSKRSEHFKTKNLLLKRRVLLSISGLLFFGIIAVLLGCIAFKVFRKPADDDYKPEEADLFVSMSRQKGVDVPCPLVEFITDAALKASSQEGEENGTICNETTPLPITSQEDQAVATEGPDTAENNGGLVSFKH